MGLAKAVAARFPSWGQDFSTLMVRSCNYILSIGAFNKPRLPEFGKRSWEVGVLQIGVILFNMLTGPSLFRAAIVALGESRRHGFQDADSRTLTK
jgi:hypothetical protein